MSTSHPWWDELFDGGKDVLAYLAGAERFNESEGLPERWYYDVGVELEFFMDGCRYVINFDYCEVRNKISYFELTIFEKCGSGKSFIAVSEGELIRHIEIHSGKTLSFP